MIIKETITEEYIQFHYKKGGNHHFIEIRYNDEVEYRRVEIDGVNNIQVSKEERLKWLKRRDEVLGKILKAIKLYDKMVAAKRQIYHDIKDFQLAASIEIDYLGLALEAHRIPYHVLKKYEEKIER